MENDGDIIVIELGQTLDEATYEAVVQSVVEFMNRRWPDFVFKLPS